MYRLRVLSGPNAGEAYDLASGENYIGRHVKNAVVLPSSKVSKRHCVLVASNGELVVRDEGSANGTYVNGALVRERSIGHGDRISVGDFVLEVQQSAVAPQGTSNILPFSTQPSGSTQTLNREAIALSPEVLSQLPPKDLLGRIKWGFEHYVMPFFYGALLKQEWRWIVALLLGALVIANVVLTVWPVVESGQKAVVRETAKRAVLIAREIANRSAPLFASQGDGGLRLQDSVLTQGSDVRLALVTNMDLIVVAPSDKVDSVVSSSEGSVAARAIKAFRAGQELPVIQVIEDGNLVVAVAPVSIYQPSVVKNVVVGVAIVSLDAALGKMAFGDLGIIYSKSLIFGGLIAALLFLILYRLTLRPLQVLNDDVDKVLKGEMARVTHEFKWTELDSLWDVLNSALQRIPGSVSDGSMSGIRLDAAGLSSAIYELIQALSALPRIGFVWCDSEFRVREMNALFEEITGIRVDQAQGQLLSQVARDEAFSGLVSDLMARVTASGVGGRAVEEIEFSGTSYRVTAAGVAQSGLIAGVAIFLERMEG